MWNLKQKQNKQKIRKPIDTENRLVVARGRVRRWVRGVIVVKK